MEFCMDFICIYCHVLFLMQQPLALALQKNWNLLINLVLAWILTFNVFKFRRDIYLVIECFYLRNLSVLSFSAVSI